MGYAVNGNWCHVIFAVVTLLSIIILIPNKTGTKEEVNHLNEGAIHDEKAANENA